MLRFVSAALVAAALALPAQAATWEIDPTHSNVGFVVKHLVVAKVRGNFTTYKGSVVLDEKDLAKSSVDVTIDTASINTGNADRDNHLKGADFFDVKKFPAMTFKSTRVEKTGNGTFRVAGDLTMHGITKAVVLEGEGPSAEMKDPGGNPHVALSLSTMIKRSDFGLVWNKVIEGGSVVGEDVKIELDIELKGKKA
jgi:polyisoprenoid-binding protein YceI